MEGVSEALCEHYFDEVLLNFNRISPSMKYNEHNIKIIYML